MLLAKPKDTEFLDVALAADGRFHAQLKTFDTSYLGFSFGQWKTLLPSCCSRVFYVCFELRKACCGLWLYDIKLGQWPSFFLK
jgi:hypothetical protein